MSQFAAILNALGDGVISNNSRGYLTYMNAEAGRLLNCHSEVAVGLHWQQLFKLIDPQSGDVIPDPFTCCLQQFEMVILPEPTVLVCKDGDQFHVAGNVSLMLAGPDRQPAAVMAFRDSSESSALLARKSYEASHDMLTRLYNRRAFDQRLQQLLERTDGNNRHSLLLLDLCKFKQINDRYGHAAGDTVLRQIAVLLKSQVRDRDIVARYGGDEFSILLEHCLAEQALKTANDIANAIDQYHFRYSDKHDGHLRISIGITTMEQTGLKIADVMQAADTACYLAKSNSNCPHFVKVNTCS